MAFYSPTSFAFFSSSLEYICVFVEYSAIQGPIRSQRPFSLPEYRLRRRQKILGHLWAIRDRTREGMRLFDSFAVSVNLHLFPNLGRLQSTLFWDSSFLRITLKHIFPLLFQVWCGAGMGVTLVQTPSLTSVYRRQIFNQPRSVQEK